MSAELLEQRVHALALARDCAALGARSRTIHTLTGLRQQEIQRLLFGAEHPPTRGRTPDTREWYFHANLLYRCEASIVMASFAHIRGMGFPAADALVAAYRYYQSVHPPPSRISFDRAFDLAAHAAGLWFARVPCFRMSPCRRCGCEFLDTNASASGASIACPFCQLLQRHAKDPRLTAPFSPPPLPDAPVLAAWLRLPYGPDGEIDPS